MSRELEPHLPIDRITPRIRPDEIPVMHHQWKHLLFLHWQVPREDLRRLVPPELEIDTFDGRAYVGLIPFTMSGIRLTGLPPLPGLSRSHEVNVRTYVYDRDGNAGVWFFSLDAAHALAVAMARALWHLPYHRARMAMELRDGEIDYRSERIGGGPKPADCRVRYRTAGRPAPAAPGTLDHFLVERYYLYSRHRETLYRGQVHHPPYSLQGAEVVALEESLIAAAGLTRPDVPPLIHYAPGVQVQVYRLRRVGAL
jgi:uncharacterized protein YqjF (DUF2071 family)